MLHTIQNNLTKEGEEMELKTRYQYTYFIYPYVIEQNKYSKYLQNLLRNKKCTLRMFEKQKDLDIYNKFLPKVRRFMFPTFDFSINKRKKFKELDVGLQATILQKYPCTIFEYNLGKNAQGKAGRNTGIFFKIDKIEIICFYTGECFITLKTSVEDLEQFDDVLNFNYKFKDIKSEFISMKQFDNIKIQTSEFDDVRKITEVIDEIVGNYTKNINIDTNKFLTYSYSCIDQEHWNKNKSFENIKHQFYKYTNVLPSNYNLNVEFSENDKKVDIIDKWEYIKFGFSNQATTLFTSGVDTFNYTKLPFLYEKVYIYIYILQLYKKIYIQKLIEKYKSATKASKLRKEFLNFTHNIWLQDITTDDIGQLLTNSWSENLELEKLYWKLKNEYDILYKESNIEKTAKSNKVIMVILITSLILNIINFVVLLN